MLHECFLSFYRLFFFSSKFIFAGYLGAANKVDYDIVVAAIKS